jgi:alkanesulfonate monooxygenase SsuD/methylene tetrahydromethanopterin reductase-like flavin-dependent oxidoreductase (luciferase family)
MFASFMRQDGWIARFCQSSVIQRRVIFGMGRSDQTCEVEIFGASLSGPEANRTLFEEQCAILMEAFDQEAFSHHGNHYTLAPDVPYRGWLGACASTS